MADWTFEELERVGKIDPELEAWAQKRWPRWINVGPLFPYLVYRPDGTREEHPAYCPVHPDSRPSASINFLKGVWYCHGCGQGGSLRYLLAHRDYWLPKKDHPRFQAL